jgi:chromosome segregation ATPase
MTYRVLSAVVCAIFFAAPLAAQQPFPTSAPAGQKTGAGNAGAGQAEQQAPARSDVTQNYRLALDEFLVLVPIRDQSAIRADIEDSKRNEERAQEEKRDAEQLERLARDQLEAQKREIDAINARLKVAKNEGYEADKIVLEADKKLAEGAKQLLEKRRELRKVEVRGWDTFGKLAVATGKAAELELELASARDQLRQRGPEGRGEEIRRLQRRINELESLTLEAQKERADLRAKVAKTEKDVVDSRLQLLKTRSKIESGG